MAKRAYRQFTNEQKQAMRLKALELAATGLDRVSIGIELGVSTEFVNRACIGIKSEKFEKLKYGCCESVTDEEIAERIAAANNKRDQEHIASMQKYLDRPRPLSLYEATMARIHKRITETAAEQR